MAKQKNFEDFFVDELKDLYSAEKQITQALPKMIDAATSQDLKDALQNHLEETENQISRLVEIGESLGKKLSGKKCLAMEGLLKEGKELMQEEMEPPVMDVALICAAQKVEHYEIASYGCAMTYANLLEETEAAELLNETLEEEKTADETLTEIAQDLNIEALENDEADSKKGDKSNGLKVSKNKGSSSGKVDEEVIFENTGATNSSRRGSDYDQSQSKGMRSYNGIENSRTANRNSETSTKKSGTNGRSKSDSVVSKSGNRTGNNSGKKNGSGSGKTNTGSKVNSNKSSGRNSNSKKSSSERTFKNAAKSNGKSVGRKKSTAGRTQKKSTR